MTIWDPASARGFSASDDGTSVSIPESGQFSVSDDNTGSAPARGFSASDDGHCSFNPESEQFSASDDNIGTLRQHGKFLLQTTTRAVPIQNPEIFCLR
jgi:hypothetical protein